MPSKQSEAVRRRWEAARLAMAGEGEAPDDESWGDLTAEPREVDYLEVEVEPPARDVAGAEGEPNGPGTSLPARRGFVSGSIYTHRKMFSTTPAGSTSTPGRPVSTPGSTSSPACCTRFRSAAGRAPEADDAISHDGHLGSPQTSL